MIFSKYRYPIYLFILLYLFLSVSESYGQDKWWRDKKYKSEAKRIKFAKCKRVFLDISDAINYRNSGILLPYIGTEVYINFLESERGYYSPDQAMYIIENFMNSNPVHSFKWKLSNRTESYAFALGKYQFKNNGYINTYRVSTSLIYLNDRWLIDQIIVN